MLLWAWKSLVSQRSGLLASAAGVAGAFVLVIFFDAIFRGESQQIVAYIHHSQPDVWVMQHGVSNMHMATSFVWDWKADKIAAMPGVAHVTPILYLNSVFRAGGRDWFAYLVGLGADGARGGPWALAAGRGDPGPGETVLPVVLSDLVGIGIGDTVSITDRDLRVVGLSEGTFSMGNSVIFVAFADLEDMLSAAGTVSYLLVDAEEGVDAETLAIQIQDEVEKVNAMPHQAFVESDFNIAMHMGVEIIFFMTVIGSMLAVLIVGFTAYAHVTRHRHELAIAKAVGMRNRSIYMGVVFQSVIITLTGFLLSVIFATIVMPYISTVVPYVTLVVAADAIVRIGLVALVISVLASLMPAYMIVKLDPASAFSV